MLHDKSANEGASPSQARFAVDSNGSVGILTDLEELLEDVVVGCGSIRVEKIVVAESAADEPLAVIKLFVEANYVGDVVQSEKKSAHIYSLFPDRIYIYMNTLLLERPRRFELESY